MFHEVAKKSQQKLEGLEAVEVDLKTTLTRGNEGIYVDEPHLPLNAHNTLRMSFVDNTPSRLTY